MKSVSSRIVLGLFLIGLFVFFATMTGVGTRDVVQLESPILMLRQAIGVFIAAVASLMILLRALDEATIGDVQTLLVALFGGLMLLNADWPVVVPLGLVLVGFVVIAVIRVFKPAAGSAG